MSKMSELASELSELKRCGEILIGISETLAKMFSSDCNEEEQESANEQKENQKTVLTITDVRKVLAEKSRKGHTAKVKELLIKYGADKLSEIDPSKYADLLSDAEVL